MSLLTEVIKRPILTEKSSSLTEKTNRYGFIVQMKANKNKIKEAVATLYNVRVLNVKTSIIPGKLKRVRRNIKKTPKYKKAFVQLEEGQNIEFLKKA